MGDDDPAWDVAVNVQKGKNGYGIYFTNNTHTITVTKLDMNSEAELAGVQPGDILLSIDGEQIGSIDEIHRALPRPGAKIALRVLRQNPGGGPFRSQTLSLTAEERPDALQR